MIEKKTKKCFGAWLIFSGRCESSNSRDSYKTYVNRCQLVNVNIFDDQGVVVGEDDLVVLRQCLAQVLNAVGGDTHSGIGACRDFVAWLLVTGKAGCRFENLLAELGDGSVVRNSIRVRNVHPEPQIIRRRPDYVDSYARLFAYFEHRRFTPEALYQFGISNSYFADCEAHDYAQNQFELLINLLLTGEFGNCDGDGRKRKTLKIRKYGNRAENEGLFIELYRRVFRHARIVVESGGNAAPKENIKKATRSLIYSQSDGFSILSWARRVLQNYQCSHVFDNRTKNPLLFEAVWNIALTPKVVDPFTGHETLERWPDEFQPLFHNCVRRKFRACIMRYNQIADQFRDSIDRIAHEIATEKMQQGIDVGSFVTDALAQWLPISIEDEPEQRQS